MNDATKTVDLGTIEKRAQSYRKEYDNLADLCQAMNEEIEAIKRKRLRAIKNSVNRTNDARSELEQAITQRPDLFERPKTMVIAGIRVGYTKQKGKLVFQDPAKVVALIRKHLPEQFDNLVSVKETPLKGGLSQLSGAELKKIGVQIEADVDQVVVKSTDTEVDKLVNALIAEAENYQEAA
jgi:arsenate reductase-like glutaredoxin family protein